MKNWLKNIFALIVLLAVFFYFLPQLGNFWAQLKSNYFPCKYPITYRINTFDTRFGISQKDFLSAMKEAEAIWEKPIGKNLFDFSETGHIKVNLIYDNRQEATDKLDDISGDVKQGRAEYDAIRREYDVMKAAYNTQKAAFETRLSSYESRKSAYEAEVSRVNAKGGADSATYSRLTKEKNYLNSEMNALTNMQNDLNAKIVELNLKTVEINKLAASLNITVREYNDIGDDLGGEFDEGIYRSDASGEEIDIYQFDNKSKLVRVLAHELGHALGLDHITDPKAIMYRLNNGQNEKASASDIVELKALCGIK